ncbi:MAG: dual specificity protein phosphatase family protein [Anaerolineae bacterium]
MVILNRRAFIRVLRYVGSFGRPGPDLSWITNLLGVSGTLHPHHIAELARMGVRAVLDLRSEDRDNPELLARYGIRFLHLPTRDHFSPSQSQLLEGARWVRKEMQATWRTVVHCKEGIGRSVAVVCCALMLGGYIPTEAVHLVRSRRWGVALNAHQMWGLQEFAQLVAITQRPFLPAADRSIRHEGQAS